MSAIDPGLVTDRIEQLQLRRWWVAEQLGISRRTLQRWLNGSTVSVSDEAIRQLAALLDCAPSEITKGVGLASREDQIEAARALISSDLLFAVIPQHKFDLYVKLAKGMLVAGLDTSELGSLYMNLSLAFFRQGQLDEAAKYAEQVQEFAAELDDLQLLLRAKMQLSYRAFLKGDAIKGLQMEYENLELAQSINSPMLIAANRSNIADQCLLFGRYLESESQQLEAIEIYQTPREQ
jgi:transcriptional regulator with XRE-family HTH domain